MTKNFKIFLFCWGVLLAIVAFILPNQNQGQSAGYDDYLSYQPVSCHLAVVPLASASYETIEALNDVYKMYKEDLQVHLEDVVKRGNDFLDSLTNARPGICDFSVCQARPRETLIDFGTDIKLQESLIGSFAEETITQICVSACRQFSCEGDPCLFDETNEALEDFKVSRDLLTSDFNAIDDWYNSKTETIEKEIAKPNDATEITTILDHALRKLELSAALLTPWSGVGQRTCIMNQDERELVERGELEPRGYKKCLDALSNHQYWPKAVSPWCEKECRGDFNEDCYKCFLEKPQNCTLDKRQKSWYADVNCQLFVTCKNECQEGYWSGRCFDCMCSQDKFKEQDDPETACLDWLCGGSSLNFVCCQ